MGAGESGYRSLEGGWMSGGVIAMIIQDNSLDSFHGVNQKFESSTECQMKSREHQSSRPTNHAIIPAQNQT